MVFIRHFWAQVDGKKVEGRSSGWLVFESESDFDLELVKNLGSEGNDLWRVRAGENFEKLSEGVYTVRPGEYMKRL